MNHAMKAFAGQFSTGLLMITCGKTMFDFGLVKLAGAPKEVPFIVDSFIIDFKTEQYIVVGLAEG